MTLFYMLHKASGCSFHFLAFAPSLLFFSGCYTPFSGICTLVPVLLWVLHTVFRHLHPALWVLFSVSWHLHPCSCLALGTTLRFPAFAPCPLGILLFFLAFAPPLLFFSGYYTPFSGICTLHSGYFALVSGVCTLVPVLLWVPHSVFRHLHPCSCLALGTTLRFLAFTPPLFFCSGCYLLPSDIYTHALRLRAFRINGFQHITMFLLLEYQIAIIALT